MITATLIVLGIWLAGAIVMAIVLVTESSGSPKALKVAVRAALWPLWLAAMAYMWWKFRNEGGGR